MWDNALEVALGTLWEALAAEKVSITTDGLRKKTGLSLSRIYACLNKMSEIGLLEEANMDKNLWRAHSKLDAISYARAVEIGIPLSALEKTVGLSVTERRQAERIVASGQIDQERAHRHATKAKARQKILRGRAASRAATTDLAKIVQDAQTAFSEGQGAVRDEFRTEALRALEALITAMERK